MNDRNKLVEENLGLVHSCCKKFKNRGIEYDDLFSSGCMGLIKAIDNFNPDYGLQLSTYAVPVILGEIKQLFRDGGAVKVSRSLRELAMKINKTNNDFQLKHNRAPTIGELSQILNTAKEKINEALNATRIPLSLTTDNDEDIKELDLPCDDNVEKLTEKLALKQVISQLDCNDKKIIELRYYKHQTQTQTAKALNMTQVQVSRREKKILLFMRQKLSV